MGITSTNTESCGPEEVIIIGSEKTTQALEYDGSNNLIYYGNAPTGTAQSDPFWRISKLTYDGSNRLITIQWASGSSAETFIWDNRASYVYS